MEKQGLNGFSRYRSSSILLCSTFLLVPNEPKRKHSRTEIYPVDTYQILKRDILGTLLRQRRVQVCKVGLYWTIDTCAHALATLPRIPLEEMSMGRLPKLLNTTGLYSLVRQPTICGRKGFMWLGPALLTGKNCRSRFHGLYSKRRNIRKLIN